MQHNKQHDLFLSGISITPVCITPTSKCIQFKQVSIGPEQCSAVLWEGPPFVNRTVDVSGKLDVVVLSKWEEPDMNVTGEH